MKTSVEMDSMSRVAIDDLIPKIGLQGIYIAMVDNFETFVKKKRCRLKESSLSTLKHYTNEFFE